ncbi:MAG: FecR domain-containing protein [Myxococcales bacterium]|nr:FecR family protein [Polyangiaceae bacterium]MDW8248248.1 FecR domain-containing protein [Myxococcales bacterium]
MKPQELIDQLVREARQQRNPGVELAIIEAKLFERIARGELPRTPLKLTQGRSWWPIAVIAAAAAAVVLLWSRLRPSNQPPTNLPSTAMSPSPAVERIQKFRTDNEGRWLEVTGKASLWMEPNSEGTIQEGDRLTVLLEEGAVILDVLPQPAPDKVEVLAGNYRISVKGTRFRVARRTEQIEVDVEHGAVQVTSLDGTTTPQWLRGPAGGTYPASPIRTFQPFHRASSPVDSVVSLRTSATAESPLPLPPRTPSRNMGVPSSTDLLAQARDLVASCARSSTSVAPGVQVTIETSLTLSIAPGGHVEAFAFQPPLAPATEQCFRKGKTKLRGLVGHYSTPITLTLNGQ